MTEYVYKNLTGEESVHLTDYPMLSEIKFDKDLVEDMDFLQDLCSAGKFIREEKNLRNRLPLSSLTLIGETLTPAYQEIVKGSVCGRKSCPH